LILPGIGTKIHSLYPQEPPGQTPDAARGYNTRPSRFIENRLRLETSRDMRHADHRAREGRKPFRALSSGDGHGLKHQQELSHGKTWPNT
jgi:hypothetical protein